MIKEYNFYVEVTNTPPYWDPDQNPLPSVTVQMNSKVINKITGYKDDEGHTVFMDIWLNINGVRSSNPSPHFVTKVASFDIEIYPT